MNNAAIAMRCQLNLQRIATQMASLICDRLALFNRYGLLVTVLMFSTLTQAKQSKEASDVSEAPVITSKPSIFSSMSTAVDNVHDRVSGQFSGFITQVDDYLSADEGSSEVNDSWARIRLDTIKSGTDGLEIKGTVKLRVVLPRSEQRFRLLLSNEDEESSASNSDAAQREQIAASENKDVSLALRFIRSARKNDSLNYDIGARFREKKAQLFLRINAVHQRDWKWGIEKRFSNDFYYYSVSGYENRFRFNLKRQLHDEQTVFANNTLEFNWKEGRSGAGIGNTLGLYTSYNDRRSLAMEAIVGYATAINDGAKDHYKGTEVRLRFRHNVWRKWFFYEIWPSVSWSASNDYRRAFGGLVRIEVFLGNF